jgi:hypothetical protein
MKEPFNSQAPHFMTKVKAYCAKVLPLVFDNSLSYYEFLGKMCHKLNECIDALNAQNLNIIEFTHMVQLEIENFEKYIESRMTEFENGLKTEWAQYKEEINQAFNDFKTQIETEWAAEKAINEKFRNDLLNEFNELKADITAQQERFENQIKADFNAFKETVNAEIEQFEQATNTDLSAFKNTMQTQQNEFETHMVELFNNFKTTEKQARTDFESNFQQLFEQWKIDTLNALNESINDWETDTNAALMSAIEEKIGGYVATFNAQLNQLTLDLNAERQDRRQHDESLQNQINQLTPEGSIKADTPDNDGNSQLYTINPDTQERTNIFPTVQGDTGTGVKKLTMYPGANSYNYVGVSSSGTDYCYIHLSSTNTPEGVNDLGNIIKIKLDDINGSSTEMKMANFRAGTTLSTKLIADGDYTNTCINAMPTLSIYGVYNDGTHIYISFKLKMATSLAASGAEEFFLYFSLLY